MSNLEATNLFLELANALEDGLNQIPTIPPTPTTCPLGQTGTPPNCTPIPEEECPPGYSGTPPNCGEYTPNPGEYECVNEAGDTGTCSNNEIWVPYEGEAPLTPGFSKWHDMADPNDSYVLCPDGKRPYVFTTAPGNPASKTCQDF